MKSAQLPSIGAENRSPGHRLRHSKLIGTSVVKCFWMMLRAAFKENEISLTGWLRAGIRMRAPLMWADYLVLPRRAMRKRRHPAISREYYSLRLHLEQGCECRSGLASISRPICHLQALLPSESYGYPTQYLLYILRCPDIPDKEAFAAMGT